MRHIILTIFLVAATLFPHGANAQLTIPYAENFDTMTNISSFTAQGFSYYGCSLSLTTSASCNSTKQLRFYSGSSNKNRVLVFPAFNEPINGLTLVFNTRPEGTSITPGYFDVGYVTDASDTSTFVALVTYHCISFNNACQLKECRFASAPAGARIAMRNRTRGTNYYWYVDDIEVLDTMSLCHWPTSFGMTNISTTSVTLAAADSTESTADFRLVLDGVDMGVFYNQTTVNGLAPNSSHTAIVRSICSNDSSTHTLTYNFTTRCNYTEQAPFFDNMESYASQSEPDCYTTIVGSSMASTTYPRVLRNANNAYSDTGYLRLQGLCNVIAMPTIDLSANQMHVKFHMRYSDTTLGTLRAGVLTSLGDTSTFVPLFTVPNHNTQYTEYEFWTDDISGSTAYVTFFWNSRYAKAACLIDDITVEAAVGCRKPNQTYIDSVDSTSVSLRWNNVSVALSYEVGYNTTNDTSTATVIGGITNNTFTITGLAPATDYWLWVRSVCDDTTEWQPIGSTRTLCLSGLSAPVNITFDSMSQGYAPRCWTTMHTPSYIAVVDEQYFGFGPVLQFSPNFGSSTVIALPHIHLPATDMRVTVTAAIDALDPATFELGYVTDLSSALSFVPMANVTSTTLTDYTFDTDTIGDDTIWIAFRCTSHAGQVDYAYISAIEVIGITSCHRPTAVTTDSITNVGVTVRWHSTNAISYDLAISTVADIDSAVFYITADTAYTLDNLLPSTLYYVWVRSYCGGEYSEWTSPLSFHTMCDSGYCTINIQLVDNDYHGEIFNYAYVGIVAVVNGVPVALAGGPGASDSVVNVSLPVCSTDSVAFIWIDTNLYESYGIFSSLDYSFTVGDGTVLAAGNGTGMYNGALVYATATPCPFCPPPVAANIDNITSGSLTLSWSPATGSSEWLVSLDGMTIDTVADTFYTFTGLSAGTSYSLGVATYCNSQISSQSVVRQAFTACAGTECEVQIDMSTLHEYNIIWGSGNAVELYVGSSLRGSASIPNGSNAATAYIPVCDGDSITLLWHAGSNGYSTYCAFKAIAPGGDTLYDGTGFAVSTPIVGTTVHCNSCQRPDSITVSNIGNNSATFTWPSYDATSYNLTIGDTVITTTSNTVTVTGLIPSTSYRYLLQASCPSGNSLATAGTFATTCGPRPLPYFEDFDATPSGEMPLCWTAHNQYPDYMGVMTPSVYRGSNRAHSGFNSIELASDGNHSPMVVSPALTGAPANKLHITFWLNGATHTGFEAGIMTNPSDTTTFVPLLVIPLATLNYSGYQFTTDNINITDSVYHFALRYTNTIVMYNDLFLDDLMVRRIPDCSEEFTNLGITVLSDSGVTVAWTVGVGDNIGATSTVCLLNSNGDLTDTFTTADSTLTLTGLQASTTYRLFIRLNCGGSVSAVSDTVTFTTTGVAPQLCLAPILDSISTGEDFLTIYYTTSVDSVELTLDSSGTSLFDTIAPANSPFTFQGLTHSTTYTIGLRSLCPDGGLSPWNTSTAGTLVVDCGVPSMPTLESVDFNSASVTWLPAANEQAWNINIYNNVYNHTYRCTSTSYSFADLIPATAYNVRVQALCGQYDNIPGQWSEPLAFYTDICQPVSNVVIGNITAHSVTVGWTPSANGNATWQVEYGLRGFSRGEGITTITADNPYTITNLESNTPYDIYIATVCSDGVISAYSDSTGFTTTTTGITTNDATLFTLVPNPAGSDITVCVSEPSTLSIIDLQGRIVFDPTPVQTTLLIPHALLHPGAYFVRMVNSHGTTVHKLIVK
ncbi:MAG: fibronectin type III domain-containing protein [Bacteroidales bacterium]|nr:fibronectin type III domain-containing protein [Bacteroidales bacterium]